MRHNVRAALVVVIATVALCVPTVALAEPGQCFASKSGNDDGPNDSADCGGGVRGSRATGPQTSRADQGAAGPRQNYVYFETVSQDSEGNRCIATTARPVRDGTTSDSRSRWVLDDLPRCPGTEAAESPGALAADYWQRATLPSPRPAIAPGRAITGKYAYLETRGELRKTFSTDTPFGPLTIDARGEYFVDWGDGATTGPHSVEGEPWPDGQITHTYIDVGTYDVVVTERWSAIWQFGPNSGSLAQLRTVGGIDDFRVEQIQAVVRPG